MTAVLKIAIIGSRGIPNYYGGFEQLAQQLAEGLVKEGFEITVYNSHKHPYREKEWNGVKIVHCYDAEHLLGTAGQFIYDLNCIRNARKQHYDILLFLGYTSSSVWGRFFPKKAVIISNMDGLEWKRSKYSKPVQSFLRYAEKLAVKYSDHCIADSVAIRSYLKTKYRIDSHYISYGADIFTEPNEELLSNFNISAGNYYMLMARMEPENNIEMILDGFHQTSSNKKFIVLGNTDNRFGRAMLKKFSADKRIIFAGAIYDNKTTHALRKFCSVYFHGHSVGGTNPSLLEAMADKALIAAHDNEFNRAILQQDAFYFSSAADTGQLVGSVLPGESHAKKTENNFTKIREQYNWPCIIDQYKALFINSCNRSKQ